MRLQELVKNTNIDYLYGETNFEIENIEYDSRKIRKNGLFIAITGFSVDGHNYINEAIKNGAIALVVEKDVNVPENITKIRVKNSRLALAKISSNLYNKPSKEFELIGITGTNGKTTTSYLVKSILEASGRKTGLIGTIGNYIEDRIEKSKNTTPESLELQKYFRKMANKNIDSCIMEVSSHSLELHRVEESYFDIGIFTNLTPEHLDLHKTIENYWNSKLKLFKKTNKCNVINMDDNYGRKIMDKIKEMNTPILSYGIQRKSDVMAKNIQQSQNGVKFVLHGENGSINIVLKIPGIFSVYNALAAATTAISMKIPLDIVKVGLESISGVEGRFEVIDTNKDFNVIIDYAHTPDGYENVLKTVDGFSKGRKVVIFGCGGNRDKTKRPIMGEIAAKYSDLCILTTDNPRTEKSEDIINDILKGIRKANGNHITILDRKEAIKYAIESAKPDDTILLLGKGHETYQIIGDSKMPFNEKNIVKDILDNM